MKKRSIVIRIFETILLVGFLLILFTIVEATIVGLYDMNMDQALWDTSYHVLQAYRDNVSDFSNREKLFQAITRVSMQFIAEDTEEFTDEKMKELTELFGTEGVYIFDTSGNTIASSDQYSTILNPQNMTEIFSLTPENPVSKTVYLNSAASAEKLANLIEKQNLDEYDIRVLQENEILIGGYLGNDRILILREDKNNIMSLNELSGDIGEVLQRSNYGPNGFYLFGKDDTIIYNPFTLEEDIFYFHELNLPEEARKPGNAEKYKIDGKTYLCKAVQLSEELEENYLVCFLPYSEVINSVVFVSAGEIAAVIMSFWIMHQSQKITSGKKDRKNISFKRKMIGGFLIGMCFTIFLGTLTSTLYMYSLETRDTRIKANELAYQISILDYLQEEGDEIYSRYMERIVRTTARLISKKEELRTRAGLEKLSEDINAAVILIYGPDGTVVSSSRNYTGLRTPYDTNTQAGEFRWLLYGKDSVVQDKPNETFLDEPFYFSGAPLRDTEGNYNGYVQLAFPIEFHDNMVRSVSLASTISSFGGDTNMVMMAVDLANGKIISPISFADGMDIEDLNLSESVLKGSYTGFLRIFQDKYIFCSSPSKKYTAVVLYYSLLTTITGFVTGLILSIYGIMAEIMYLVLRMTEYEYDKKEESSGEKKKSERSYGEKKKSFDVADTVPYVLLGILVVSMIGSRFTLKETDIAYYVFVNKWENGLHIYSFTRCLLIICTAGFIYSILSLILQALYPFLPMRHETILRMALSVLKYALTVGTIIICAGTLGAPTTSLIAISGVVTLIFSMGAQTLVADVLSGLFIIFEGTYKVGDMIAIDQWYGQVREIGIRNTRIFDPVDNNIKIINNSTIRNIINYSECPTRASITVAIDYDQDYAELERIFKEEMDTIRENIRYNVRDLRLRGIEEFQDSGILVKFSVFCKNEDYLEVQREMRREIKAMFDRHNIPVPFPQVVVSDREDAKPLPRKDKAVVLPEDGKDQNKASQ